MKMLKFALLSMVSAFIVLSLASCDKDKNLKSKLTLTAQVKQFDKEHKIEKLSFQLKEKNTGKVYDISFVEGRTSALLEIPFGLYDVMAKGEISYKAIGDKQETLAVQGVRNDFTVNKPELALMVELYLTEQPKEPGSIRSLMIAEIYPTGILHNGKKYIGDNYFRIYNNSDKVVYADGLLITESSFLTTLPQDIDPKLTETCFPVQAVYMIPGNGTEVPIQPYSYLTICDQAINHQNEVPGSVDLSHADFEWYDETPASSKVKDIDNPEVKNLEKIYCYTKTIWSLHDRGGNAYAIAKMETSKEDFLANYKKKYVWNFTLPDGTVKKIDKETYIIPTEWIIDGVGLSFGDKRWSVMPASVERGFTYVSTIDKDPNRYGKCVLRKTASESNGAKTLKDTNNSTEDFLPVHKATLLP